MAYQGKLLRIDLTKQTTSIETIPTDIIRKFMGGKGLAAYYLYNELEPDTDPLSPGNILAVMDGPLTGASASNCVNFTVASKSPATCTWDDSHCNGFFGPELRFAGFLGILIKGAASAPVHIHIEDGGATIHSASELWGMDTFATSRLLKERFTNDRTARVLCIGQAGERKAKLAGIMSEGRMAARGGLGAVMGSKNLKAISVLGHERIVPADKIEYDRVRKSIAKQIKESPAATQSRLEGTPKLLMSVNSVGGLPTNNFQSGYNSEASKLSGGMLKEKLWDRGKRRKPCRGCAIQCAHVAVIDKGVHAGIVDEGPEYETVGLLGSNCGIMDPETVAVADYFCDYYGLDTISVGSTIAFLMECNMRGLISGEVLSGLDLRFGNEEAFLDAVQMAGSGTGVGNLIANGVRDASAFIGVGDEFAMHVKGLEIPAYLPRAAFGQGLAYAVSDRGACHLRPWTFGKECFEKALPATSAEGKGKLVKDGQERNAIFDSIGVCKFITQGASMDDIFALFNAVTGFGMNVEEFDLIGRRVNVLTRLFNNREGFSRKDDTLPGRELNDAVLDGASKGNVITQPVLDEMLDDYYGLSGYTEDGVVTEGLKKSLGL
ncbi:MAG: aldehyde ferredoxin oxidoreductase family protein [Methanosarcinaceae archaeon]|nr:aldehyde ferredoxin oxidoreductase family protein [Methanosarcinaceae archaeon]